LRLRGKGQPGAGANGDLYLKILIRPEPGTEIEGNNLVVEKAIDLYTAVLGGKVQVDTPFGRFSINIPAGIQNNSRLRVRGKGMPAYNHLGTQGDMLVKVKVTIPKQLSSREKQLFEQLREISMKTA
jgi:curved DNA-binding protein